MQPNQNFLKYFPDAELPEAHDRTLRSSCIRIGDYIVIRKILEEYKLPEMLGNYIGAKDIGLFLDLVAYSIVMENNAGQYYPGYAYNHPLFAERMKIYTDSRVSDLLHSFTEDQSVGFLNEWNEGRDHREKIYISYDSTNKNCQAGDIEIVEFGHPKDDQGLPVFNYAIAYDTHNSEPLFYEKYPGSINDISQLEFMLDKAYGYGYRKIGFILDRGYFSKQNLYEIDRKGYSFVIMVRGMADFVNKLVRQHLGTFEKKRINYIDEYELYGKTVRTKLYVTDEKDRYVHIYHSVQKESAERTLCAAEGVPLVLRSVLSILRTPPAIGISAVIGRRIVASAIARAVIRAASAIAVVRTATRMVAVVRASSAIFVVRAAPECTIGILPTCTVTVRILRKKGIRFRQVELIFQFSDKTRAHRLFPSAVEIAAFGTGKIQPFLGAGDGDVHEPPLFFHGRRIVVGS